MKIVFVYGHMYNGRTWSRASEILRKEGVPLIFLSQQKEAEKAGMRVGLGNDIPPGFSSFPGDQVDLFTADDVDKWGMKWRQGR